MVDIPRYIRLDFLLTLLGIVAIGFYLYLTLVIAVRGSIASSLIIIFGATLFLVGYYEMWGNYRREQAVLDLKSEYQKLQYARKIERLKKDKDA